MKGELQVCRFLKGLVILYLSPPSLSDTECHLRPLQKVQYFAPLQQFSQKSTTKIPRNITLQWVIKEWSHCGLEMPCVDSFYVNLLFV